MDGRPSRRVREEEAPSSGRPIWGKKGELTPSVGRVFLPFQSLSSVCARAPPSPFSSSFLLFVFSPEGKGRGRETGVWRIEIDSPERFPDLPRLRMHSLFPHLLCPSFLFFLPLRPNGKGGREISSLSPEKIDDNDFSGEREKEERERTKRASFLLPLSSKQVELSVMILSWKG